MKWTNAVTLKFVKIYFKRDCLWNPSNPAYSLDFIREVAYGDVIAEFEAATSISLTVKDILKKLKELKLIYLQETHKMLQKARSGIIYKPSLVWFNEMDRRLKDLPNTHRTLCRKAEELGEIDLLCQIKEPLKSEPKSISNVKKEMPHSSKSPDKFKNKSSKCKSSALKSYNTLCN